MDLCMCRWLTFHCSLFGINYHFNWNLKGWDNWQIPINSLRVCLFIILSFLVGIRMFDSNLGCVFVCVEVSFVFICGSLYIREVSMFTTIHCLQSWLVFCVWVRVCVCVCLKMHVPSLSLQTFFYKLLLSYAVGQLHLSTVAPPCYINC